MALLVPRKLAAASSIVVDEGSAETFNGTRPAMTADVHREWDNTSHIQANLQEYTSTVESLYEGHS